LSALPAAASAVPFAATSARPFAAYTSVAPSAASVTATTTDSSSIPLLTPCGMCEYHSVTCSQKIQILDCFDFTSALPIMLARVKQYTIIALEVHTA